MLAQDLSSNWITQVTSDSNPNSINSSNFSLRSHLQLIFGNPRCQSLNTDISLFQLVLIIWVLLFQLLSLFLAIIPHFISKSHKFVNFLLHFAFFFLPDGQLVFVFVLELVLLRIHSIHQELLVLSHSRRLQRADACVLPRRQAQVFDWVSDGFLTHYFGLSVDDLHLSDLLGRRIVLVHAGHFIVGVDDGLGRANVIPGQLSPSSVVHSELVYPRYLLMNYN